MISRRFVQCDVFSTVAAKGNGLAVVVDGDGLSDADMQAFAAWTNLAETTFLMPPHDAAADYKVRIFTPAREMLFAGHPTLGSCAAWLHTGGRPKTNGVVRQECGVGVVDIDVSGARPAFAAPATSVAPLADDKRNAILQALDIAPDRVVRCAELSNGPVWQVFELASADDVLTADSSKIRYPAFVGVGLIGAHRPGGACHYEVRMLGASSGMSEDPITGSLNAAIARWMYGADVWRDAVTIAQGTCIGRQGRVYVHNDTGTVWIGGETRILIEGTLQL